MANRKKDGKFKKGHKGLKPKGAISKKTKLWEELGEYIVGEGAEMYMQYLKQQDPENFMKRYEMILEYFKPKQSRTLLGNDEGKQFKLDVEFTDKIDESENKVSEVS